MFYKRKILLALLQIFGGSLPKIDFQKYLFLLNIKKQAPYFEFIPYKYGCYSFQANQDMSTISKYNLIEDLDKRWHLVDKTDYLGIVKMNDKILISNIFREFNYLKGDALIKYVYEKYPYFAIHSLKAKNILNEKNYTMVVNSRPYKNDFSLCTIGYEGKSVEYFTNQLIKEDIKVLCDIRKNAFSMKYGFSKKQLKYIVENVGITYVHIPELGIQSNKRQQLNSKEDYKKLFKDYEENILPANKSALEEIHKIFLKNKRIALMCFEADHNYCHRSRTLNALTEIDKREYIFKHI